MIFSATERPLIPHPGSPDLGPVALTVGVAWERGNGLTLAYRLQGDLASLRIPRTDQTLPRERLWAHTCFEVFVAGGGAGGYREFNFSPNGQWMRFDFSGYRRLIPSPPGGAPRMAVQAGRDALEMKVCLPGEILPPGALLLGVSAVLEHQDGRHAYWALHHPASQPDFHHLEGFVLALKAATP